jgi:hypothetical protein
MAKLVSEPKTKNTQEKKMSDPRFLGEEENKKKIKMIKNLPYLATPGTITNCLKRIKEAATPPRVTSDFINSVLEIKGGAGTSLVPFLKKIGFVSSDGTPTEFYKNYRNQSTGGKAIAEAIKTGYKPLLESNEYFYKLTDAKLKDCIVKVTGLDNDDRIIQLIFSTLKNLFSFASFDQAEDRNNIDSTVPITDVKPEATIHSLGNGRLNLSYTINLNLPATTDQAVFNAIFKSLKENIL